MPEGKKYGLFWIESGIVDILFFSKKVGIFFEMNLVISTIGLGYEAILVGFSISKL